MAPQDENRTARLTAPRAPHARWRILSLAIASLASSPAALAGKAAQGFTVVPQQRAKSAVVMEMVPSFQCLFSDPAGQNSPCDGSEIDVLRSRQLNLYGRITVYVTRQTGHAATSDECQGQKILLVSQRPKRTLYWTLDVPGGRETDWQVRRLSEVPAGKSRLLWVELEGIATSGPAVTNAFVFGLAGGAAMAQLVSGLPLVRMLDDGTAAQIDVDFPSPTEMRVVSRTPAIGDEQKKWLGSRPLSPAPKSEGTPIDLRVDYPGVDVCGSDSGTDFTVDVPTVTADFGKVAVHFAAQGPADLMRTSSAFLVAEGPSGGSVIPIDHTVSSRSEDDGLVARRLEEIHAGGRPLLWLEVDLCRRGPKELRSTSSCDRRGYLLDRDAKGLLRYLVYGLPLIDDPGTESVYDEKKGDTVETSLGPKTILDVRFPDAHTLAVSAQTPKLTAEQKKWLGSHALP
jgi:hypothetical protein